jgi:hypothetical protein
MTLPGESRTPRIRADSLLPTGLRGIHTNSSGLWIAWSGATELSPSVRREVGARLAGMGACAVPCGAIPQPWGDSGDV